MSSMTTGRMTGEALTLRQTARIADLSAGTAVLTLAGTVPVECLTPGTRIITRDGVRSLCAISSDVKRDVRMILVAASALGTDQPEDDLHISPNQQILIRDWRAKALKGADQALIAANKLIDGEYIRAETVAELRLFMLEFDTPVVIYACGLELASTPMLATV